VLQGRQPARLVLAFCLRALAKKPTQTAPTDNPVFSLSLYYARIGLVTVTPYALITQKAVIRARSNYSAADRFLLRGFISYWRQHLFSHCQSCGGILYRRANTQTGEIMRLRLMASPRFLSYLHPNADFLPIFCRPCRFYADFLLIFCRPCRINAELMPIFC
jgi:hypothetical protein